VWGGGGGKRHTIQYTTTTTTTPGALRGGRRAIKITEKQFTGDTPSVATDTAVSSASRRRRRSSIAAAASFRITFIGFYTGPGKSPILPLLPLLLLLFLLLTSNIPLFSKRCVHPPRDDFLYRHHINFSPP